MRYAIKLKCHKIENDNGVVVVVVMVVAFLLLRDKKKVIFLLFSPFFFSFYSNIIPLMGFSPLCTVMPTRPGSIAFLLFIVIRERALTNATVFDKTHTHMVQNAVCVYVLV